VTRGVNINYEEKNNLLIDSKKALLLPISVNNLLNPEIYLDYILKCISSCVKNELLPHYKQRLVNFVEKIIVSRRIRTAAKIAY
jgi:hypothetical protein